MSDESGCTGNIIGVCNCGYCVERRFKENIPGPEELVDLIKKKDDEPTPSDEELTECPYCDEIVGDYVPRYRFQNLQEELDETLDMYREKGEECWTLQGENGCLKEEIERKNQLATPSDNNKYMLEKLIRDNDIADSVGYMVSGQREKKIQTLTDQLKVMREALEDLVEIIQREGLIPDSVSYMKNAQQALKATENKEK